MRREEDKSQHYKHPLKLLFRSDYEAPAGQRITDIGRTTRAFGAPVWRHDSLSTGYVHLTLGLHRRRATCKFTP